MLGSSLVALGLAAAGVQYFYSPPVVISGWRTQCSSREQNQFGYRGHPISFSKDDYVILLVGDSNVEAASCSFDYLPESRLEYYLKSRGKRVHVFSLGSQGYGQDQQLLALREYYRKYRADLVLLWQTAGNDIWNNTFPTHWPTNGKPKPTFWLENGQLKGPTERIGEQLRYPSIKILSLFEKFRDPILKRDTLWEKKLPAPYKPLIAYKGPVNYEWQKRWDANDGLMRGENFENEKSHLAMQFVPPSDRVKYGLELTRRLLKQIEKLVIARNGQFAIFWVSPPKTEPPKQEQVYVLNGKYYRASEKQIKENIHVVNAVFKTMDIHISLETWGVGPDNPHLNEHATDEAMMHLAETIDPLIPNRYSSALQHKIPFVL